MANNFLELTNKYFIVLWEYATVALFVYYMLTGSQTAAYLVVLQMAVIILYLKLISPDDKY